MQLQHSTRCFVVAVRTIFHPIANKILCYAGVVFACSIDRENHYQLSIIAFISKCLLQRLLLSRNWDSENIIVFVYGFLGYIIGLRL